MLISVRDLDKCLARLKAVLGSDLVRQFPADRPKNIAEAAKLAGSSHPIAMLWPDLLQDVKASKERNALDLSESSIWCLGLISIVEALDGAPNLSERLEDLRKPSKYYPTLFELRTAAAYRLKGWNVSFIPHSRETALRNFEFEIDVDGETVAVECKSLEDKERIQNRILLNALNQLPANLYSQSSSLSVQIDANKELVRANTCAVRTALKSALTVPPPTTLSSEDGCITISTSPGDNFELGFKACFDFRLGWKIVSRAKRARKQLPDSLPCVVHIEIPQRQGHKFLKVVDDSYDQIADYLVTQTRGINAVVISGMELLNPPRKGNSVIHYLYDVVANPVPRRPLPSQFRLLGNYCVEPEQDSGARIEIGKPSRSRFVDREQLRYVYPSAERGTFKIELVTGKPLSSAVGEHIVRFLSPDATTQLQIWQTPFDRLRVDLRTPVIGRQFADLALSQIVKPGLPFELKVEWNENGLRISFNNALVAFNDSYYMSHIANLSDADERGLASMIQGKRITKAMQTRAEKLTSTAIKLEPDDLQRMFEARLASN